MYIQGQRIDSIIIKRVATKLNKAESIIEKIHNFQFATVKKTTQTAKSIELTDLGVLKINPKAVKRNFNSYGKTIQNIENRLATPLTDDVRKELEEKLETCRTYQAYIKTKE